MTSVFSDHKAKVYQHRFAGTLLVGTIAGATPSDPNVAESWLKTKLAAGDDLIREMVAEIMVERGVTAEEAVKLADQLKHLNGFKRDELGLYLDGRCLKSAIREAANVRWPKRKWGPSNKGTRSFFAEHVFVVEDRLHLGVTEPTGVAQRFVHTFRGNGIQYEEYVTDAKVDFTVIADFAFDDDDWADLWCTGEEQGIGAARSQGYGRYEVVRWEPLTIPKRKARRS